MCHWMDGERLSDDMNAQQVAIMFKMELTLGLKCFCCWIVNQFVLHRTNEALVHSVTVMCVYLLKHDTGLDVLESAVDIDHVNTRAEHRRAAEAYRGLWFKYLLPPERFPNLNVWIHLRAHTKKQHIGKKELKFEWINTWCNLNCHRIKSKRFIWLNVRALHIKNHHQSICNYFCFINKHTFFVVIGKRNKETV